MEKELKPSIKKSDLENLKFEILDKTLPTIIEETNVKKGLFNEGKEDKSHKLAKNVSNARVNDEDLIYLKDTKNDVLRGYGIGMDGNLYNELGDLVIDGYNKRHKCKEDIIRKRSRLPAIGSEEDWKRARTTKVQKMKRQLDNLINIDTSEEHVKKKRKLQEADDNYQRNLKYKSVNNDQKRHRIASVTTDRANKINKGEIEISLNAVLFKQEYLDTGQIVRVTDPIRHWFERIDGWTQKKVSRI